MKLHEVNSTFIAIKSVIKEQRNMRASFGFRLERSAAKLESDAVAFEKKISEVTRKYGLDERIDIDPQGNETRTRTPEGEMWIPPEYREKFQKEMEELRETEIDVSVATYTEAELDQLQIPGEYIKPMMQLLSSGQPEAGKKRGRK
ncbi:MAG: hypothetical protein A2001_01405 [Treponema sp. GWC1_61_84]|nr:MAG: hypothetical protein A2001_01405 [Treponema sp. GWC1_61_84]